MQFINVATTNEENFSKGVVDFNIEKFNDLYYFMYKKGMQGIHFFDGSIEIDSGDLPYARFEKLKTQGLIIACSHDNGTHLLFEESTIFSFKSFSPYDSRKDSLFIIKPGTRIEICAELADSSEYKFYTFIPEDYNNTSNNEWISFILP